MFVSKLLLIYPVFCVCVALCVCTWMCLHIYMLMGETWITFIITLENSHIMKLNLLKDRSHWIFSVLTRLTTYHKYPIWGTFIMPPNPILISNRSSSLILIHLSNYLPTFYYCASTYSENAYKLNHEIRRFLCLASFI